MFRSCPVPIAPGFSPRLRLRGWVVAILPLITAHLGTTALCAADPAPAAVPTAKLSPMVENPFFTASPLPFLMPPFDRITDESFAPAYAKGMVDQIKEVEAIANNQAPASFDNTIVALERSGLLLTRVDRTFSNLAGANTNPAIQQLETVIAPKLSAHRDAIALNGALFARIQALQNQRDALGLDAESKRLLERYYKDFVRAGARLSEADKTRLKAMNAEIATLQTAFSQNVLKEKNALSFVVEKRADLTGLPENEIAAAALAAKEAGQDGKYLIALSNTTGQPALESLTNRKLRKHIMEVSLNRNSQGGDFDTLKIIPRIAKLRAEQAQHKLDVRTQILG